MSCQRCGGRMVETMAFDEEGRIELLRCLNCGDRRDAVIDYHRTLAEPPEPQRSVCCHASRSTFKVICLFDHLLKSSPMFRWNAEKFDAEVPIAHPSNSGQIHHDGNVSG